MIPVSRRCGVFAGSLVLLTAGLSGCTDAKQAAPAADPVPVSVVRLAEKSVPVAIQTVGRTEGSKEVEVRARVTGILDSQVYSEGAAVKKGAELFRLERAPFEIRLEQARATLAQERARNEQARRTADRFSELVAQRAVSKNDAEDALSTLKASDAAVQAAAANVREAELNLSYTSVGSPINGITGRAQRSEGSLVTADSDSSLLTSVIQTDPIWVRFALSQSEYEAMREAMAAKGNGEPSVTLLAADGTAYPLAGRVNFASSAMDTEVGTVQLRAEFANPELNLLPGQFLQVKLVAGEHQGVTVPQAAVLTGEQGKFVWVVDADGTAAQRVIEPGTWIGEEWEVRSGLHAGESVIVDNLLKLKPGAAVTIQNVDAASRETRHASASNSR